MVEEHQREQPARLRFLGGEGELAGEPDRLAGEVRAGGSVSMPGRVDEVEHTQHDGEVAGLVEAASLQGPFGAADPLRHRRLGDEEGSAISRVVRPPTARRVSATWDAGARSGWQQQKSRKRVSSPSSAATGCGSAYVVSSRRCRATSLRWASTSRRVATVVSHAPGSRGGCSGHTRSASSSASWSASSAASKSSPRRTSPASTRGARARRTGSSITPRQSSEDAPT